MPGYCQILGSVNMKFETGIGDWQVTFGVNGKKYTYKLDDRTYHSVQAMSKYSQFKAFNLAKSKGERIT